LAALIPYENQVIDIHELFECKKTLGTGGFGHVESVVCKEQMLNIPSDTELALKVVSTAHKRTNRKIVHEIATLKVLRGVPGVIRLHGAYCDDKHFGLLFEQGKPLFETVMAKGKLSERMCKWVMFRLLGTLVVLHEQKIAHRDIKLENIGICDSDDDLKMKKEEMSSIEKEQNPDVYYARKYGVPKLIDFGDAIQTTDSQVISEFVGTICYLSPERLRRHHGWETRCSDMWALGVTLYEMLTGKRCFYGENDQRVLKRIMRNKWHWPKNMQPDDITPQGKDFIQSLLKVNPVERLNARQALMHPWFDSL